MNPTFTTTALPRRIAALMRTAIGAIFIMGALTAQSDPQRIDPIWMSPVWTDPVQTQREQNLARSGDEAQQICFTSWYLRINEYLFDGREFKRFIAASPAQGDGQIA